MDVTLCSFMDFIVRIALKAEAADFSEILVFTELSEVTS
jgi:hypothetical protein